eukprot:m.519835 g.519835  ORF g.519835 m.519835 type:complete len:53 (+) comp21949_c0_seq7:76-234(+)
METGTIARRGERDDMQDAHKVIDDFDGAFDPPIAESHFSYYGSPCIACVDLT